MITDIRTFGPFTHGLARVFSRADLELYGLDHLRPTYTCSIFFNDDSVTADDADSSRPSFAGTFALFGHAECWGASGHCQRLRPSRRFDWRPSPALTPAFRRVIVTGALQQAIASSDELRITLVAVTREPWPDQGDKRLLVLRGLQLATFA